MMIGWVEGHPQIQQRRPSLEPFPLARGESMQTQILCLVEELHRRRSYVSCVRQV
jgi:hypothetical protein